MREPVKNASGQMEAKYVIANRAFSSVVDRLEAFHKAHPDRPLRTSLTIFNADSGRGVVPFGDFEPERLRAWIQGFSGPTGATPLGAAMRDAARPLLDSDLKHLHLLVVTDGINTSGPDPVAVIPSLYKMAGKRGAVLGIHVIAFDTDAMIFAPLKKLNVTVASAADEKHLDTQLAMILEEKILLEDEETAAAKP